MAGTSGEVRRPAVWFNKAMPRRHKVTVPGRHRAYALLMDHPVRTAVVFVHGFLGHPQKTWLSFQTMADSAGDPDWWSQSDLYFFDYQDFNQAIDFSSRELIAFLKSIYPQPDASLLTADLSQWKSALNLEDPLVRLRENTVAYERLILVGHSEGGVVIRKAMLTLAVDRIEPAEQVMRMQVSLKRPSAPGLRLRRRDGGWINLPGPWETVEPEAPPPIDLADCPQLAAQVCLFAPALMGAAPSGILGILARKIDVLYYSRAFNDLERGSPLLTNLQRHTEDYARRYPGIPALRARILWGKKEQIVAVDNYQTDLVEDAEPNQDHTSVCKPRPGYTRPLEFISHD